MAQNQQQEIHIILTTKEPTRVYPAVTLALGSAVMGAKAFVYCTMDGLSIVRKGEVEKIQLAGAPPLSKLVEDAKNAGVKFVACAPSKEMLQQMGITAETVLQGVELEDVFGFLNNALPAARQGGIVLFV